MARGGARTRSGPKAVPTSIKVLHGSKRARAQAKVEPLAELGAPEKPDWLGEIAADAWDDLVPILEGMRILTKADRLALEMLASVYEEWRSANETIENEGSTQEVSTQYSSKTQAHPSVAQRSDAFRRLHSMIQEFGLTPSARSRIKGPGEREKEDPLGEIVNRGQRRRTG